MFRLSTGALSRLILSDDSLRIAVNDLRTSKVLKILIIIFFLVPKNYLYNEHLVIVAWEFYRV